MQMQTDLLKCKSKVSRMSYNVINVSWNAEWIRLFGFSMPAIPYTTYTLHDY